MAAVTPTAAQITTFFDTLRAAAPGKTDEEAFAQFDAYVRASEQAKSGAAGGQQRPQQQPAAPTQEPPNLYEVAQYMGPLDMPDEFKQGFMGPW